MNDPHDIADYANDLVENGTGDQEDLVQRRLIRYPFEKYEITVVVGPSNEFLGIVEVAINKQFLTYRERNLPHGYHDVDEFYRE